MAFFGSCPVRTSAEEENFLSFPWISLVPAGKMLYNVLNYATTDTFHMTYGPNSFDSREK
jgi:hypothetical protein